MDEKIVEINTKELKQMDFSQIDRIWLNLKKDIPSPEIISIIQSNIELEGKKLCFGYDSTQLRHLLVPNIKNETLQDKQSKGIQFEVKKYVFKGQENSYLDLCSKINHLDTLFSIISLQVLVAIFNAIIPELPGKTIHNILDQWREFITGTKKMRYSFAQFFGLYGELKLLDYLTDNDLNAIRYWFGPTSKEHDFFNSYDAIEVKTKGVSEEKVTINGITQLETPVNGSLFLFIFIAQKVEHGGETIFALIDKISAKIGLSAILDKMGELRGIYEDINYYSEFKFEKISENVYLVDEKFPKITTALFKTPINPKVSNLHYDINLGTVPPNPLETRLVSKLLKIFAINKGPFQISKDQV